MSNTIELVIKEAGVPAVGKMIGQNEAKGHSGTTRVPGHDTYWCGESWAPPVVQLLESSTIQAPIIIVHNATQIIC